MLVRCLLQVVFDPALDWAPNKLTAHFEIQNQDWLMKAV